MRRGLDLSNNNGQVADFGPAKANGYSFVIHKASEGTKFTDGFLFPNIAKAVMVGMEIGAYHFATWTADPVKQADHFLDVIGDPSKYGAGLWLDLEKGNGDLTEFATKFLQQVEGRSEIVPGVYTVASWWNSHIRPLPYFTTHPLWVANYNVARPTVPHPWTKYDFWQFTDAARIPGIGNGIDANLGDHWAPPVPAPTTESESPLWP